MQLINLHLYIDSSTSLLYFKTNLHYHMLDFKSSNFVFQEMNSSDEASIPAYSRHSRLHQKHSSMDKQRLVEEWLEDEQAQEMERQRKMKEEEDKRLAEEMAFRNRPVSMKVMVERAMHLPAVEDAKG